MPAGFVTVIGVPKPLHSSARVAGPVASGYPRRVLHEYLEVAAVIAGITGIAWFVPIDYRLFGDIYLLGVIALCLRVGRGPVLFAAFASVLAWNFVIVPPRMSFSRLDVKDGIFLGTYFVVALIAGQLTARLRAQQRRESQRKQRVTALFQLTHAMNAARTLDEAAAAALQQADEVFGVSSALLLVDQGGSLATHPASKFKLDARASTAAVATFRHAINTGRPLPGRGDNDGLYLPIVRAGAVLGVFAIQWPRSQAEVPRELHELMEAFSLQIGLHVEREQLRIASERERLLAESERLYRTLLDSVSHELKTPVAVLNSAAENLTKAQGPRREMLAVEIRTAAKRLNHLVANLLNQTRLDAGRVKARPDWCDVRDLIASARRAAGDGQNDRPIKVEVPADMPLFKADAILMEQVLANLLLNALHHTPAGTVVTISAGTDPTTNRIFIAVTDCGPGIAPEIQEKLFQKFERGDHARPGGLGLGLSIVRGFMLAQDGEVVAAENPGGGARFILYLPHEVHETVPPE